MIDRWLFNIRFKLIFLHELTIVIITTTAKIGNNLLIIIIIIIIIVLLVPLDKSVIYSNLHRLPPTYHLCIKHYYYRLSVGPNLLTTKGWNAW